MSDTRDVLWSFEYGPGLAAHVPLIQNILNQSIANFNSAVDKTAGNKVTLQDNRGCSVYFNDKVFVLSGENKEAASDSAYYTQNMNDLNQALNGLTNNDTIKEYIAHQFHQHGFAAAGKEQCYATAKEQRQIPTCNFGNTNYQFTCNQDGSVSYKFSFDILSFTQYIDSIELEVKKPAEGGIIARIETITTIKIGPDGKLQHHFGNYKISAYDELAIEFDPLIAKLSKAIPFLESKVEEFKKHYPSELKLCKFLALTKLVNELKEIDKNVKESKLLPRDAEVKLQEIICSYRSQALKIEGQIEGQQITATFSMASHDNLLLKLINIIANILFGGESEQKEQAYHIKTNSEKVIDNMANLLFPQESPRPMPGR